MYNNSANAVKAAEDKGRVIFTTICSGMTWTANEERFAVWDLSGTTTSKTGEVKNKFVEVKNRNFKSTEYGTTFLEVAKLNNLLDIASANNGKAFYFATYTDGKSFLFDLTSVKDKYPAQQQWMNDITIGDFVTQKVLKDVIHLPLFKAERKYK